MFSVYESVCHRQSAIIVKEHFPSRYNLKNEIRTYSIIVILGNSNASQISLDHLTCREKCWYIFSFDIAKGSLNGLSWGKNYKRNYAHFIWNSLLMQFSKIATFLPYFPSLFTFILRFLFLMKGTVHFDLHSCIKATFTHRAKYSMIFWISFPCSLHPLSSVTLLSKRCNVKGKRGGS